MGSVKQRHGPLRILLGDRGCYGVLYPTHIERDKDLMLEAAELSHRRGTVDLEPWSGPFRAEFANGGDANV